MVVSYKLYGSSTWVVLFDASLGAKVIMPDFKGTAKFIVQKAPGFGAPSQSNTPNQNADVSLPWKFGISYDTFALATAAVRTTQQLGGKGIHIKVVQDGETQYYPNGTIDQYEWEQNGAYVLHSITFNQNLVTVTEPTTP